MEPIVIPLQSLLSATVALWAFSAFGEPSSETKKNSLWRNLLTEQADSVTWVSTTVRIEISAGGRSFPPSERKLEALGTVLGEDGLIVLSLNEVDPSDSIQARMRTPGDINVNY